jgi:DNA-binding transcriptional LysR family regulator
MDTTWDHYRTFVAVLKTGSLSAAARSIGLTQPTVGRHIDALESQFGNLFIRTQSGFAPTELAQRLRVYAESIESNVAALVRESTNEQGLLSGTVRVTASEIVGSKVLPAILTQLHQTYPSIKIELVLSDKADNLLTREADIAIRMFKPQQSALIAKKLGSIEVALHAHKTYLDKRGRPKQIADLQNHSLIGFDTETEFIRNLAAKFAALKRSQFSLKTDSNLAQLAAICSGFGIGFCQVGLARQEKSLERVLPNHLSFKMETWIVMHENLKSNPSCLAVFNTLRDDLLIYISKFA